MIYITGDIHGSNDIHKLTRKTAKKAIRAGKTTYTFKDGDYLIICGDFGLIWYSPDSIYYKEAQYWLNWLNKQPYTTLFVDGNHENHDMLDAMSVTEWHGGKVHRISDKIIHLMRGQVFDIDGNTFFTFGGASSHDKQWRVKGVSWWERELPNQDEIAEARKNLTAHNNTVDFIITHCGPQSLQNKVALFYPKDVLTQFFEDLEHSITYKQWYNGHYHIDRRMGKHTLVYNKIITLNAE